jgi:TetR/AcrR family transcriptional regulator
MRGTEFFGRRYESRQQQDRTRTESDHAMSNAFALPESTRARIIRSARRCFAINGFVGTSTRQIAEEAKVAQSLLLYHFKSKEGLWREVMSDSFRHALRVLNDAAIAEPSQRATDQLLAGLRALVDICASDPDFHRLLIFESREPNQRFVWMVDSYFRQMVTRGAHFIAAAQEEGTVRDGDPFLLFYGLLSIIGSVFSFAPEMELVTGRKPPTRDEVERIVRPFLMKTT